MVSEELRQAVISDIVLLSLVGIHVVVVHGGGPEINEMLQKIGKQSQFVDGLRYTDEETMDVVQQVLCGKVNKGLVSALNQKGGKAIGLCGIDGGLLSAKTISPSYGRTGEVVKVDVTMVNSFLNQGYIPVIATVAQGADGLANVYSVSANVAAAKLAVALGAEKLIQLTDKESMLQNPDAPSAPCPSCICPSARSDPLRSHLSDHGAQGELQCGGGAFRRQVRHLPGRHRTSRHSAGAAVRRGIGTMLTH